MKKLLLEDEQPFASRLVAEFIGLADGPAAWQEFCKSAPPPLDLSLSTAAIRGAFQAFHTACCFLESPNAAANSLGQRLQLIYDTLRRVQDSVQEEDATHGLIRTLTRFPQWRLLAQAGALEFDGTAFQFVVGVELAVCMVEGHSMAQAFSISLRRDRPNLAGKPALLLESLFDPDEPLRTGWTSRFRKQLTTFQALFEGGSPRPLPKKSLNERLESQWMTKAAFASFEARAAVLDDRCLSEQQFRHVMQCSDKDGSREYATAIFFVSICGFTPSLVAEIPVIASIDKPTVCYLEFSASGCVLVRDFERLAYDAAAPQGIDGQPASLVLKTPLPRDIEQHLRDRMRVVPHAHSLGELVPLITHLMSEDALYPNIEEMEPTWAKLRPTAGRILRQRGFDSFLTALLTGDFSHTAKSKLYYSTVSSNEWWMFVAHAYEAWGFEAPSSVEGQAIAFGTRVTPSTEQIRRANLVLSADVERTRPRGKASLQILLDFHATYSRLIGFQVMVLMALRESGYLPLPGFNGDCILYVVEKSSAGRSGGMAALIPTHLQNQFALYRIHCQALLARSHEIAPSGFVQWLHQVSSGDNDLCFCTCSVRGVARPLATGHVLEAAAIHTRFAPDLGRKYLENELRLRKVLTEDIDRVLRHDVKGQGATTGTSDAAEAAWVRRVRPKLDGIAQDLGFRLTRGLGGGRK